MDDNSLERLWYGRSREISKMLAGLDVNAWRAYGLILIIAAADAHIATRQRVEPYASLEDADSEFVRCFLDSVSASLQDLPDTIAQVEVDQIPMLRTLLEIDCRMLRGHLFGFQS